MFNFDYQITDRDGVLAYGYYTWAANPFDLLSSDPFLAGFAPRTFEGTTDGTPALDSQLISLTTLGLQWLNISEGGWELPVPDNYLTPWLGFQTSINFALARVTGSNAFAWFTSITFL